MVTTKKRKMGLLGKKVCMSQVFLDSGDCIPVTVVEVGPCVIVQKKTQEKDGYEALQLGFEEIPHRKLSRPARGHFDKKGVAPFRFLHEFRLESVEGFSQGQSLDLAAFKLGESVDVTGISKGKGFQGVIKRHGKAGGPASHGSRFHRTTGSIGQRTFPGKVFKNMKLPGHMGNRQVTLQNLEIIKIIPEERLLFLKGNVPGANHELLVLRSNASDFVSRFESKVEAEQQAAQE